ncbi:Y-family DNA polymerase [Sediminibacterium sp.]|uniref:Y-family DNA polymerase n=1 Tax=Sediminibacterium sp. TaxID=1917865 RepID=UPI0027368074|nr:Y-family DNA polymerase [Sediminibacterium sp.]MDP3394875.1 Y-family DNA polymerase [Sediminibacterium sp.]MDP3568710.1 Y-family DNA polymerase [Sediminibacterium sp.]
MIGIIDCNSFYCSCERLFLPALQDAPVVVLSNNDGCIVSRSDEAKQAGVAMGVPYFQAKQLIEQKGIHTFSSNYNLYGDLSWRVMETLRLLLPAGSVEVYSVDECFITLDHIAQEQLAAFSLHLKDTVEQWTGIKVSIGVAPTKVLSKVANRLAKKNKAATNCIMVLDSPETIADALQRTAVEDIWGVGRQYAEKLRKYNINSAFDLRGMPATWVQKNMGGIVGERLLRELNGIKSIEMKDPLLNKKMIATTRMFGKNVTSKEHIKEAIATYITRAAEKLRRQQSAASVIYVFVVPKQENNGGKFRHGNSVGGYIHLPLATAATNELIKPAVELVDQLFEEGCIYKKAGVILSSIVPDESVQGNLFAQKAPQQNRLLMSTIDNINFAMRNDMIQFATAGTQRNWKMRQELRSPRYTSRWEELCKVI